MSEWVSTFPGYSQLMGKLKKAVGSVIRTGPIPRHVGVIMDGNRRYAKNHKMELKEGHNLGFDSMASTLELLYESGVECATVYAFSIENFKRLRFEVEWLMDLAKSKFRQMSQHGELCEQYGIRIRILGNVDLLPPDVQHILRETETITKGNTRAVLNVCFPYTLRDEMASAVKRTVEQVARDPLLAVDEQMVELQLYTADSPPLDILVRTSGTYRLLDFLLWQCVPLSCAVVFSEKLWPDFTPWDMSKILLAWSFNTYWYGLGAGQTMPKPRLPVAEPEPAVVLSASLTAYERFLDGGLESDSDIESQSEPDSENEMVKQKVVLTAKRKARA